MTTSEQIKVLCLRSNISVSNLARQLGQTPQNFNAKLKRNTVSQIELDKICELLNVQYKQYFELPTGEVIK